MPNRFVLGPPLVVLLGLLLDRVRDSAICPLELDEPLGAALASRRRVEDEDAFGACVLSTGSPPFCQNKQGEAEDQDLHPLFVLVGRAQFPLVSRVSAPGRHTRISSQVQSSVSRGRPAPKSKR